MVCCYLTFYNLPQSGEAQFLIRLYLYNVLSTIEGHPIFEFRFDGARGWVVMGIYDFGVVVSYNFGHHSCITKVTTYIPG